jgi:hypothetical protein
MSFRLFRRVRIVPGLRVNLSPRGVSLSVGRRGAWFTAGPRGPAGDGRMAGNGSILDGAG